MKETEDSPGLTPCTNVPVWTVIPCFLKPRSATLEMSASSVGRTRSSASNSVVSVPSRAYAEAISVPDAPAPMTAIEAGRSSSSQAPAVSITRPPKLVPGTGRATEPVARMTVLASISVPSKSPPTLTLPSAVTAACPLITSMEFFLKRPPTPPVSVLTTLSRRAPTPAKSTWGSLTTIPKSSASRISDSTSAERRTALAGMHA